MKKFLYGFGGLSYSVIGQTIANFFMFYATSVLGIRGTYVGIIIAISTIWDGISDSIMGFVSDNYPILKMGKRNGYMMIATIGMAIFNLILWCVPSTLSVRVKFVWILVSMLLLETFNTMFSTPYSALAIDLASSYNDRTRYNSSNTIFYLIGVIIPSVLMVIFLPNTEEFPVGQLNPKGYVNIALVTSMICLLFGLICSFFATPKLTRKVNISTRKKLSIRTLFNGFLKSFKNKKLRKLILGYVFTSMVSVFLCSVGLHFFTYSFFYSSWQITTILLMLIIGNIISQPLWIFLSEKIRKKPALILGIIITVITVFGIISIYFFRVELYAISFYLMIVLIFICGIGSGALYTLPVSLYGDEINNISKGRNGESAQYMGTLTFAGNISNSVAQLLIGVMLDVIKFDSSMQVQSLVVQSGLALILFVGVQTSLILGCLVFSSYSERGERNC